ncbi:hypothetical protein FB567DRAFT_249000 [Paraphoma chrysanthemicola]|uniref:Rhodopsin domain-containing protein n=2 Tax=Paraphoma chrysanthemicola TaxID=798071 RepID=A0A8K0QT18_9PLEO|nr:hypothetical protein FB567DRAFT_249000 [Paraphoma chrysanthemicola]
MTISSDNPRGRQAVEISAAFTGIAGVIVALRLYTRFFLVRCPGIEDYGIVLAMICSIGLTITIAFQAKWGMGQHISDLEPATMQSSLKAFWASLIVYYLSLGLTKGSMVLQYLRVFTTKRFQIAAWAIMGVVVVYTFWTVFSSIFACRPIRAFWTREEGAICINQFAMWFTNAGINIVTDFALIILPMPVIRNLNLGRRQKIALMSIFAVGGFVCVVSILRLQSLVAISNSTDPTYDNPPAATWSSVETNVGIICSCLPLLRPLLTRILPGAFTSQHRSSSNGARQYATIGSTRPRRNPHADDLIEMTKHSHVSSEDAGHDIQVVTDISVKVESGPEMPSGWEAPDSKPEWEVKGLQGTKSSTETLPRDVRHVV